MLTDIPSHLRRGTKRHEEAAVGGALDLLTRLCELVGVEDLSGSDVLDVGCGVKFTQAILNHEISIRSYTGVDVYGEMIDFLRENVHDRRFHYEHVDLHNDLYNPDGPPMTSETDWGVGGRTFDIICLYSVFTHLNPADYVTMLRSLRPLIRPGGRLVYTVFIDELTPGGHGLIDFYQWLLSQEENAARLAAELQESGVVERVPAPFRDLDPSRPLMWALYSREHAFELIEGTGWEPIDLVLPTEHAQHTFVCRPV